MSKQNHAEWIERVKAGLPGSYKRFEDIERDRRLQDADRIELLQHWPAHDDFERARIRVAIQNIETRIRSQE